MAKQSGIHELRGKVNGMSYYGSKVGGSLVRKINEGMSARVKTGKEYANTRKNNSEFGMCGDFAGSIIKPITQRWRFILDSIATGMMVKTMKELAVLDTASEWGKRVVKLANYGTLYEKFNSFSKNEMPAVITAVLNLGVQYNSAQTKVVLSGSGVCTSDFISQMDSIGATGYSILCYALFVNKPAFDAVAGTYTKAVSKIVELSTISAPNTDLELNNDLFSAADQVLAESPVNTESQFAGLLTIFMPLRKIGGQNSVLQQHCSAYLVPITAAV